MTPNARIAAAITVLETVLDGVPAEQALLRWARGARYAGSKDRAALRDLVFDSLRRMRSRAALGGACSGRGLMLGMCREAELDPMAVFTGQGHDPALLSEAERAVLATAPPATLPPDLPDWLLPYWRDALGDHADCIADLMRQRAPVWLRANPLRATPDAARAALAREGVVTEAAAALPTALRVTEGARRVASTQAYRDGWVELQDLSPQLACAAISVPPGGRVLDYCAGGGGKALAIAAQGAGQIEAHDADPRRMRDLPERAMRAGAAIRRVDKPEGLYDVVLADVPCSGSGTWRRTPDAKWRFGPADLDRLTRLQAQIMEAASAYVAPGGQLVYMTCSLLAQENGQAVTGFLARHAQFTHSYEALMTPLDAGDGFYLAILRRDPGALTGC